MKLIFKYISYKIKQIFCKHSYKQTCKFQGHNIEHDKQVIFDYDFVCVKCGKKITIDMDEGEQLKQDK